MRKTIVITSILASLCILGTVNSITADTTSIGLQATFTTNPLIVAPGTNGYIELTLKSIGTSTISDIDIDVDSWDPAVVEAKGNWNVYIEDLEGGDSQIVLYEFSIASSATPGIYQVVFEISSSRGTTRQTAMLKVEDDTILDIVSVDPSSMNVGQVTTLIFNITNSGAPASNILFLWDDPSDLILPVGSDNRITVPSIPAGNYSLVPVNVVADPSTTAGVYPLSITLEFYDRTGTKQTTTSEVGMQIGGTTDFEVVLQQSSSGATSFAITNTGVNTASSVIVSIPSQMNYVASGTTSVSLGNLDEGDYTLASFELTSTGTTTTNMQNMTDRPTMQNPPDGMDFPSDFNFTDRGDFMNRSFGGGFGGSFVNGDNLTIQIAYTDLFGVRQTVLKDVTISSTTSFTSSSSSSMTSRGAMSGFPNQNEEESNDNGMLYIAIGAIGIIIIIAVLKIGKNKTILDKGKTFYHKMKKGKEE